MSRGTGGSSENCNLLTLKIIRAGLPGLHWLGKANHGNGPALKE
jgi:hypothetical protein